MLQEALKTRHWWVYKITSPSERAYIGITSNLTKRFSVYKSKAATRQTAVFNSIRKYGYESHEVSILEEFDGDSSCASDKEMFWIRSYMTNKNRFPEQNGLNLTDGGDGTIGYKATAEMIEKLRLRQLGKKASPETIEKKRKAMTGRKMNFTHYTPDFLKSVSEKARKYRHTDEAKKKIGEASKGNKHRLGAKMTPEQIEHRSSMIRGRKISPEIVAKSRKTFIERHGKPVFQYTLDGTFINQYPCISIAEKEIGIPKLGIYRALTGKYKQSRGFLFKYN